MPESMDFKDLDSTIILTPDECWEAYHHHRYTNPWFNLTEVNINRPTSHSYISKGQHDETGTCVGETFVRQGDLHTSVYERTEVRLLVQEHLLHTLPGVLSMSGMDVNLPFNVRVPAERQNLTDERFGVMVWRHDEPKCAKEVQYTSVYYNLFTGSVDVHFRWISHNSAAFFLRLCCAPPRCPHLLSDSRHSKCVRRLQSDRKSRTDAAVEDKFDGALVSYNEKTHPDGSTPGRSFAFALSHVQFIKPEFRPRLIKLLEGIDIAERQKEMCVELTLRLFLFFPIIAMFNRIL